MKLAATKARVSILQHKLANGAAVRATKEWGGANVVVSHTSLDSGYREVVTPHSLEVSWVIEQLRDSFHGVIDACSKFDFYGRLEIAANRSIAAGQGGIQDIGLAMIEAAKIWVRVGGAPC